MVAGMRNLAILRIAKRDCGRKAKRAAFPGNSRGRIVVIVGLLALTGCGETLVALEPVITPENAVVVPNLEGHYEPHRRYVSGNADDDEEISIDISRDQSSAPSPYYTFELRQKDKDPALANSILIAPLSGNYYLVQVPLPQGLVENFRENIQEPRFRSDNYYYLHIIRILDTASHGRIVDLRRPRDDGYRILSLLGERYRSEIVTVRFPGMFGGSKTKFVLGLPDAILKTVSEAPHLDLEIITTFQKSEPTPK